MTVAMEATGGSDGDSDNSSDSEGEEPISRGDGLGRIGQGHCTEQIWCMGGEVESAIIAHLTARAAAVPPPAIGRGRPWWWVSSAMPPERAAVNC